MNQRAFVFSDAEKIHNDPYRITAPRPEENDFAVILEAATEFLQEAEQGSTQVSDVDGFITMVLGMLEQIIDACDVRIEKIETLMKRNDVVMPHSLENYRLEKERGMLYEERKTWWLIYLLVRDFYDSGADSGERVEAEKIRGLSTCSKKIVDEVFREDVYVRKLRIIKNWLETNYKLEKQDEKTEKLAGGYTISDEYRKQGDEDVHETYDEGLCWTIWTLVRGGDYEEAVKVAMESDTPELCNVLLGSQLYDDPFVNDSEQYDGNSYGLLFRETAKHIIQEGTEILPFERALYAIQAGAVGPLLDTKVCKTWDDYLWSYIQIMLDQNIVENIANVPDYMCEKHNYPATVGMEETNLDLETIFSRLESHRTHMIRTSTSYQFIQSLFMCDKRIELVKRLKEMTEKATIEENEGDVVHSENNYVSPLTLRFCAHMIIFMLVGKILPAEEDAPMFYEYGKVILQTYIKYLISRGQNSLVALYTHYLIYFTTLEEQTDTYAKFLTGIKETEERERLCDIGLKYNLDISNITRRVVEYINTAPEDKDSSEFTADDLEKIKGLEWLVFSSEQWFDLLVHSNALIRAFLETNKFEGAVRIIDLLDSRAPTLVKELLPQCERSDVLINPRRRNDLREHVSLKCFVVYKRYYDKWCRHQKHKLEDLAPPRLAQGSLASDKIQNDMNTAIYNEKMKEWGNINVELETNLLQAIEKVVSYPYGWLRDCYNIPPNDKNEEAREQQMKFLRSKYIPQLFLDYHHILTATNRIEERIAQIVADPTKYFFDCYDAHDSQALLALIRKSTIALLENKDYYILQKQ